MTTNADPNPDPDADRDFRTYIPESLWTEYYVALGKFFHEYASVENNLNIVLSNLLEEAVFPTNHYRPKITDDERRRFFEDPVAGIKSQRDAALSIQRRAAVRAVLGSMRIKQLKDTFGRLLVVTNAPVESTKEVERIFAHLSEVQSLRDRLAHNGATPDMRNKEGWFYTSDHHTQNLEEKWSIVYFKASTLLDMARDLNVIPGLLFDLFNPEIRAAVDREPSMQSPEMLAYQADVRGPFKFKPSHLRREMPRASKRRR